MAHCAHRVRRQTWHLRVGSADAAFAVRARIRSEVEDLLPAFNHAFDAWAPDEAVVRIPRLELRLRIASLDELAGALGEALHRAMPRQPPASRSAAAPHWLALLLRYLETGMLDWHAAHAEATEVVLQLRAIALAELPTAAGRAPADAAAFERAMQYYVRLLQLLPGARWHEVAASVGSLHLPQRAETEAALAATVGSPHLPERADTDTVLAANVGSSHLPQRAETDAALDATTETATASRPAASGPAAAIRSIDFARARLGERAALVLAAIVLAAARSNPLSTERLQQEISLALGAGRIAELPAPAAQFLATQLARSLSRVRSSAGQPAPAPLPQRGDAQQQEAAPQAFALMASNAGLILLHPFLPRLFEACGLYELRGGLEPRALPRAAALLHWLAAGHDEVYEFELGAVKLLLGLRPEAPLPAGADLLGERERDEGAALLRAAIGHWKVLKGTSIGGLRVSFLQRRGALREEEAGWRLQLEPESFDVLLKQLPWGIATVKLPWMIRPLFTHWPTP